MSGPPTAMPALFTSPNSVSPVERRGNGRHGSANGVDVGDVEHERREPVAQLGAHSVRRRLRA